MKQGLTEIVFILDRSGSMSGLEKDTIGGFNSTIEKQKQETGEAYVSTVLFDTEMEVLHDRVPLARIEPLTDKEYYARGGTALLDAIGGAIHHIGNVHKYARDEDRPEKTIFVITTDGKLAYPKADGRTMKGMRAYISVPSSLASTFANARLVFNDKNDDETSGIQTITRKKPSTVIYNLSGQRLKQPRKGLNIIDGKLRVTTTR